MVDSLDPDNLKKLYRLNKDSFVGRDDLLGELYRRVYFDSDA